MAQAEVARLYRSIQDNPDLRGKLSKALNQEEFITIAQSHGYEFTAKEYLDSVRFQVEELECNLSEIPGL